MNLTIARKDLIRLASRMQGVADRKGVNPILANVLIRAEGTSIGLAATDLFLALTGAAGGEIRTEGSIAVPAKPFFDRLKEIPDGPINLTEKDGGLLIKGTGARKYTLRSMTGSDFPPIPSPSADAARLTIDVGVLSSLMALTHFAVALDETRAHLNSALVEWDGSNVRMVATDGHRLALCDRRVEGSARATMLLPLKALNELRRIADEIYSAPGDGAKTLTIVQQGPHAFFQGGGMTFGVKLVDAVFPPYMQVIPENSAHTIRCDRAALLDAVRAIGLAASQKTGGVKLAFTKGTLQISSADPDSGEGYDEVSVDYNGPNQAIGFNGKYLVDALGALTCDEVAIGMSGELDPVVVRPVGEKPESGSSLVVIMPMRI